MIGRNKKYKALMLDLDGTTITHENNGLPSQKVVDAVHKAQKKIFVGVATARPYFASKHIIDYLKLSGPCIVNNGAQVIDALTGKVLWEQYMAHEDVLAVSKEAVRLNISLLINLNDRDISPQEIGQNKNKVLGVWSYPAIAEKKADLFIEHVSHISTISVSKAPSHKEGEFYVVISHVSATKQHGILEVGKILGINTHEIIGVGDGDNDFPLLMACGLRVAMGNAVDGLKDIADYIAPPVFEDGVVDVINKFVLFLE